jgi:hypothetical protein
MHAAFRLGIGVGIAGILGTGIVLAVRAGRPDPISVDELAGFYLRSYDQTDDATLDLDWSSHRGRELHTEHTRYAGGWDGHRNIRALLVAADADHSHKVGYAELVTLLDHFATDGVIGVAQLRRLSNRFGLDSRDLREAVGSAGLHRGE